MKVYRFYNDSCRDVTYVEADVGHVVIETSRRKYKLVEKDGYLYNAVDNGIITGLYPCGPVVEEKDPEPRYEIGVGV